MVNKLGRHISSSDIANQFSKFRKQLHQTDGFIFLGAFNLKLKVTSYIKILYCLYRCKCFFTSKKLRFQLSKR